MKLLFLIGLIANFNVLNASFCGESSIPFSFEALPNGQPVLGCARPTCFGWTADGEPIQRNSQFYRVLKMPDGFQRKHSEKPRKMNRSDREFYKEQVAVCEKTYESESCLRTDQWVGGIGPTYNATMLPLVLQCCTYEFLRESSTDRGVAVVNPGQIVVAGEVLKNGRQYAFDYIADLLKIRNDDGSVSYDVTIRRFPCLPIPDEPSAPVDEVVLSEMNTRFQPYDSDTVIAQTKRVEPVAFQAPIQEVAEPALLRQVEILPQQVQPVPRIQPPTPAPPTSSNVVAQSASLASVGTSIGGASPSYPLYGSGDGGTNCFSGDTTVRTYDGREVQLRDINVADWVMTKYRNEISYAQITSWIHRLPEKEVEFYRLSLKDGSQLKLTAKHYIYKTICDRSPGEKVNVNLIENVAHWVQNVMVGDCLYRVQNAEDGTPYFIKVEVTDVDRVKESGIYAPMTSTGDIIVNGIYASCHNVLHSHSMQYSFFEIAERISDWFRWLNGWEKSTLQKDIPHGIELLTEVLEIVLPTDLHTF